MDWNDLPPHERPGYVPPEKEKPSKAPYREAQHAGVKYAPALTPQFTSGKPHASQAPQASHMPPPPPLGGLHMPPLPPLGAPHGAPPPPLGPNRLSVGGRGPEFDRAPSPGLPGRMDRLSVNTNGAHVRTVTPGQAPPASPLLEAYQGAYQSMPSPLLMPHFDDDLDDLPPLSQYDSRSSKKSRRDLRSDSDSGSDKKASRKHRSSTSKPSKTVKIKSYSHTDAKPAKEPSGTKRRVTLYDAEKDAKTIAEALNHSRPDNQPLIEILPTLSHDQLMELRSAYKKVIKVQGRGINIAKHIKLKTSGAVGKLMYVLALGRWESEGYWANYWYQSNSARRELLIEALMGRTNGEIKLIKADFQDKRYGDSLTKCMEKELKADKFRTAVLLALEERRQEEADVWPLEYRNRDVDDLYEALRRREGGETAILQIVIGRSDAHLRQVLRTYERKYQSNFAKDALKKSNNLVGEVIAHILNGVINRAARDALLLRHALTDLSAEEGGKGQDRTELLISRLVRMHWDQQQFRDTKDEYYEKYHKYLEDDIERYVRGEDMREACLNLCETR
ncbi:Annexin [Rhizodiscina lignyota]|uniref:Annexin n=1 Tax=Rhizodiscina lignyota TaxID=1504668 RepID=A0A9P4IQ05_9PEZI|nr:Annexin [Rhizodiscina lignyota]